MNTYFTKNPIVGTPLTPSVIKQINTAVRRFMPIAGTGIRTTVTAGGTIISAIPAPASNKTQETRPLPFEVRYDRTLDSGAGGWKIYLPTEHLVRFDGAYLDPLKDVTPILDENGVETGWYSFDKITLQDNHVWLVVSESSSGSSSGSSSEGSDKYNASFANKKDTKAIENICIAEVSYEEATETKLETIAISQSVIGAIDISSGGDVVPDDISTEFIKHNPSQGSQPDDDEGKLQIKGFKAGTPNPQTTVADDLKATGTLGGHVLFRESDGTLSYKSIGSLNLPSSTVNLTDQTVLTGLSWNAYTHKLEISSAKMNVSNGLITSWTPQQMLSITTTSITTIPRS